MPATRKNISVDTTDQQKSFADWGLLSLEALRLKCHQYVLAADGKKSILQKRLTKHFIGQFLKGNKIAPKKIKMTEITCMCNF